MRFSADFACLRTAIGRRATPDVASSVLARAVSALALVSIVGAGCRREEAANRYSPPDLQVVNAGNEPRQLVRFHPPPGTAQKLEIAVTVDLSAGGMGGPMPTMVLEMTARVDALMPNGHMTLRTTIDDVKGRDVPESTVPATALTGPLEKLEGLAINAVLSATGRLTGAKLDRGTKTLPPEMDQQINSLVASFESTMMPLPDEPIGVGAVWRTSREIAQNGMRLTAVSSVTVVSLQDDVLGYTIDTTIHGADQTIKHDGMTIEVQDIVGNGTGKGTIDLGKLAITSELAAELRSVMTAPEDVSPTKMKMTTQLRVRPL